MSSLFNHWFGSPRPSVFTPTMQQTWEVDVPEKEGETKPRRHISMKGQKDLFKTVFDITNHYENFQHGLKVNPNGNCLGHRQKAVVGNQDVFVWETYSQVNERILNIGSALMSRNLEKGSIIGIFSNNRPEWFITDLSCQTYGLISCPLYETLGNDAIEYIMTQTEMTVVFLSNDKVLKMLSLAPKTPALKLLVVFGSITDEQKEQALAKNIELIDFKDFENIGQKNRKEIRPNLADDCFTICYTSGTTGLPKGVMLRCIEGISASMSPYLLGRQGYCVELNHNDVYLSYLPLAHVLERIVTTHLFAIGASIGCYSGDTLKLLDDIALLRPTLFVSVPRLFNRVFDKVTSSVEAKGGLTKYLFDTALAAKKEYLKQGYLTHWFWDNLVFSNVRSRLGGRVRAMLSGSAPISPDVLDFMRLAFSCEVYEGYGQTENSGAAFITLKGDYESGQVGPVLPHLEFKLIDIPEMSYTTKDKPYPHGEVCTRGSCRSLGYYKNPEKTKEDFDEDGWLHTGDVGLIDEYGRLKIIDRKKNIFKLSQGEYVAPEKVENAYQKTKYVAQAFVYGDSLKSYLVGVFVPDEETLIPWCQANNIPGSTLSEVVGNPAVKKLILEDANKAVRATGLKGFEIVKDILLYDQHFSIENDLLTPTFKLKRNIAKVFFKDQLDQMQAAIDHQEHLAKMKLSEGN